LRILPDALRCVGVGRAVVAMGAAGAAVGGEPDRFLLYGQTTSAIIVPSPVELRPPPIVAP
jgi:hypothetical protein